jgi:acetoin utilization deacetylase AcuC-like enzyme
MKYEGAMMITVFSEDHQLHFGKYELIEGQFVTPFECPERMEIVMSRLEEVKLGEIVSPMDFGLDPIRRVHSSDFVDFIKTAHGDWVKTHGNTDALPICWPCRTLRQVVPEEIDGKLGYYSFDAGTPITSGTWQAATASANVALTGAGLINEGQSSVFSACRPPGHHASADLFGGYCFFNNAAIAAQSLLDTGAQRVTILDVDYHHGNGTQAIFYDRSDVMYVSLHADPKQEFPHFLGYADETGEKEGKGCNFNFPMPWGTQWPAYRESLEKAVAHIRNYSPDVLIVSLGVDTFEKDPISKFQLKADHFLEIGSILAGLKYPTLFIMEGGYAVDEIGVNMVNVLSGFENS